MSREAVGGGPAAGDGTATLRVLGSTSGLVPGASFCTALAIQSGDDTVLVDAGAPVATLLPQSGIDFATLRAVLLTHWHADHSAGLILLLQRLWLHNGIDGARDGAKPVVAPLYGPPTTARRLDHLRSFHLLPYDETLRADNFPLPPCDVAAGSRLDLAPGIAAVPYATTHWSAARAEELREGNFGVPPVAYGYVIDVHGRRVVYSGDAGSVDDCVPHLAGAAVLVHELGHFDAEEVGRVARAGGVPRLLLVHLALQYHGVDGAALATREVRASGYEGEVIVACDGLVVAV